MEEEIENMKDLRKAFLENFWSKSMQDRVLLVLNSFYYVANGKTSRVGYATRLFAMARDLKPRLEEKTLVRKVARHFTQSILIAVMSNGIETIKEPLDILEIHDQTGPVNRRPNQKTEGPKGNAEFKPYSTDNRNRNNRTAQTANGNQNQVRQVNTVIQEKSEETGARSNDPGEGTSTRGNE